MSGLAAIREKGRRWAGNIVEIHGGSVSDPVVAGEWFSVAMGIDATFKDRGRMPTEKICVFRVRNGKIVHAQFFYPVARDRRRCVRDEGAAARAPSVFRG